MSMSSNGNPVSLHPRNFNVDGCGLGCTINSRPLCGAGPTAPSTDQGESVGALRHSAISMSAYMGLSCHECGWFPV